MSQLGVCGWKLMPLFGYSLYIKIYIQIYVIHHMKFKMDTVSYCISAEHYSHTRIHDVCMAVSYHFLCVSQAKPG